MSNLTRQQHDVLLLPIKPHRVGHKDGLSHVEAYDVRAHLSRIFGFGQWSEDVLDVTMLYEQSKEETSGTRWRAAYRATVRLTIHATGATYTECATGSNFGWLPDSKRDDAHDMAIKTAASQALKRCAINLGDQFGLSLYNKGSLAALVGTSLVVPDPTMTAVLINPDQPDTSGYRAEPAPTPRVDDHITEQLAPEDEQPETPAPQAEEATPPAPAPAVRANTGEVDDVTRIRDAALEAKGKRDLARLLMEAGRLKVAGAMTTDGNGNGRSLETVIQQRIKEVAA
jgi:hypothetical protein